VGHQNLPTQSPHRRDSTTEGELCSTSQEILELCEKNITSWNLAIYLKAGGGVMSGFNSSDQIIPDILTKNIPDQLKTVEVFDGLTDEEYKIVADVGEVITLTAGEVLTEYGSQGDHMFALIAGCVEVQFMSYDDDESYRNICQLRAGHVIGEMSLLDGEGRSARVMVQEVSTFVVFSRDRLFRLMETHHRIGYLLMFNLAKTLSKRLRYTNLAIRHGMFG